MVIIVLGVAALTTVAWAGKTVLDRAFTARDTLTSALPLVSSAKQQILDGDTEGAKNSVDQVTRLTATALQQTQGRLWQIAEGLPFAGPNLAAVRAAVEVVDGLANDVMRPATEISLENLRPVNGAFQLEEIDSLADTADSIGSAIQDASQRLEAIDTEALVDEVANGVDRLDVMLADVGPLVQPARDILGVLPAALGADGARNYLVVFQNNAESRGTGGNPAALVLLTADAGRVSITQQASSADFQNFRSEPVAPLNGETAALYGDKVGENIMDVTMTPDFKESTDLIRAFWAEEFDSTVDAVVSFDPVALSYLLPVTGPVTLETGETLAADNAVPLLLNQVYWRYQEYSPVQQNVLLDAFFGDAASKIFTQLTANPGDPKALVAALTRAVDEGRLMYVPTHESEAALVAESRLSGTLPTTNNRTTVLGAYVNDISRGKLDYYLNLSLSATSTQCEQPEAPLFTTTATLVNALDQTLADDLPWYVSTGDFFPVGHISSDVVLYGPVGSTFVSGAVDGAPVNTVALPHLGRPAVKINVLNAPGQTHTISATFAGAEVADGRSYGPLEIRHTPMVRGTAISVEAPGCSAD